MNSHSLLHDLIDWLSKNRFRGGAEMKDSVVFHVGCLQDLPEPNPKAWISVRPPYPKTVIELDMSERSDVDRVLYFCAELPNRDGFMVFPFQRYRRGGWAGGWALEGYRIADFEYGFEWVNPPPPHLEEAAFSQILPKWQIAAHIFNVLRCVNVLENDHCAPERLNAKRMARGKCPIFSFKTLVLSVPNSRRLRSDCGGTHSSPRVHLRRGHIRNISAGRAVWVQSCVVGSKHGLVEKDYRLESSKKTSAGGGSDV